MSSNQITGTVYQVDDEKEYGDRGFRKRRIVLLQNQGKYDNYIPMEFIQDGCDMGDNLPKGTEVTVEYRISGRKWVSPEGETRFFCNLEVTDVINYNDVAAQSMSEEPSSEPEPATDDVPF